jgi:hypothetical protein
MVISITSPIRSSFGEARILSPILNGRDDSRRIPAIALLIVFLQEKPIKKVSSIHEGEVVIHVHHESKGLHKVMEIVWSSLVSLAIILLFY